MIFQWFLLEFVTLNIDLNLCIDIGNSSSKIAIYKKDNLLFYKRFLRLPIKSVLDLIENFEIEYSIISSTRNTNNALIKVLKKKSKLIVLSHQTKVPFKNNYLSPETLGRDRIAVMAAASKIFPKKNTFVADLGTCNTYDFITSSKRYIGGNIAPGLMMRIKSMHKFTDKLPMVTAQLHDQLMGLDTTQALQNGAVKGIILEIEGYIRDLRKEYGPINVILTGGEAGFFAKHFKKRIFAEPNLVLLGLNKILQFNID